MLRFRMVIGLLCLSLSGFGCANTNADDGAAIQIDLAPQEQGLSAAQIKKLLLGYTYPLDQGSIYFSSTANATLVVDGEIEDTTWYVMDNSSFCFVENGGERCVGLSKTDKGNYLQELEGIKKIITPDQIVKGKKRHSYYR